MREYRQTGAFLSADLLQVDPVEVNFNNCLQLAGVRLMREAAGITLKLHWRALRRSMRPWRCFAHVLSRDKQISSIDHGILQGRPPISQWAPLDEGYQSLRLWLADPPEDLRLRLGVYDPEINVRAAVLASTLPITDESSAVWIELGNRGTAEYTVRFHPIPLSPCSVVFESGIELAAYSLARHEELVWLRLKWILRRGQRTFPRRGVRFFGHLVPEPAPEMPALAQFDQDLAVEDTGPATAVEQHVVRALASSEPAWLRTGLFKPSNTRRLDILSSSVEFDSARRCAYLPLRESH